jgi:hypothetical protein
VEQNCEKLKYDRLFIEQDWIDIDNRQAIETTGEILNLINKWVLLILIAYLKLLSWRFPQ